LQGLNGTKKFAATKLKKKLYLHILESYLNLFYNMYGLGNSKLFSRKLLSRRPK
jgi:uncharacterized Zn-finger protein